MESGGITAICHSGSVFALLVHCGARYRFNLVTSPGQEIGLTAAETMDYVLDLPTTRVIVLFIEAIRDPERFVAALENGARPGHPGGRDESRADRGKRGAGRHPFGGHGWQR